MPEAATCNLFLVGAPKAGTTSLDALLRTHPDVYLPDIKEPCHFCPDVAEQLAPAFRAKQRIDLAAYLDDPKRKPLGLAWVTSRQDYERLFAPATGQRVVGDCSTFYLSSAVAPAAIHAYNPDARIVAVLRRPLDRIRSHYEMDRAHGVVSRALPVLIEEELALGEGAHWGNSAYYVGASRYQAQLQAFHRRFQADRICVMSFEALLARPEVELRRLYAFLGIDVPPGGLALPKANGKRAARFSRLNRALHVSGFKPAVSGALKRILPASLEQAAKSAYYRRGAGSVSAQDLERARRLLVDAGLDLDPDVPALAAAARLN